MHRRANGDGSIYQRSGRRGWYAAISVDGRRKVYRADTRKEAATKLAEAQVAVKGGSLTVGKSPTVGAYLERWLEEVIKPRRAVWTWRGYRAAIRTHIAPVIGNLRLDRLTGQHIDMVMNRIAAAGASPKTVANVRTLLRSGLNQAVRWRLIGRNPVVDTEAPRRERHEIEPLTTAECRTLLQAVRGDRLEALYTVAVASGLRQGEGLGLTWADVDLSTATLHVRRQLQRVDGRLQLVPLKTERSRRSLAMPAVVVAALTKHREGQLAEGRALLPSAYVFTTPSGGPLEARTVLRWFVAVLARARLRRVRFHDLRHATASLMLVQGVPMRVIMEVLGHSQLSTTSDTYSHVVPDLQREAAARIDVLLS